MSPPEFILGLMGGRKVWLGPTFFAYFIIALKKTLLILWVLGLFKGLLFDLRLELEWEGWIFIPGLYRGRNLGS